jgi:hypothetical protein
MVAQRWRTDLRELAGPGAFCVSSLKRAGVRGFAVAVEEEEFMV